MPRMRQLSLRVALQLAVSKSLEYGWLYLPNAATPTLDTPCLLVSDEEYPQALAEENGFPQEGLDTDDIEGTVQCARQFQEHPSDDLLLESFIYYWRFDAWLPKPDAPDPPSWDEVKRTMDREYFEGLGVERQGVLCKKEGCARGAIASSVFCRVHHFEMIKKEVCPFHD